MYPQNITVRLQVQVGKNSS